jgi:dephospho-CoA kinase
MGEDLIRDLSAAEFVRRVIDRSGRDGSRGLVVEGIRHDHIAEAVRTFVRPVAYALVNVDAPRELRELRLRERGRAESSALVRAEKHSTERQVATLVREQADFVIRATNEIEAVPSEILRALSEP